jgi:two-component sensor histidine kinase
MAAKPITPSHTLVQELQTRLRQQAAVARLGQQALGGMVLESLTDEASNLLCEILEAEYCDVQRYLPDQKAFLIQSGVGWKEGYIGQTITDPDNTSLISYILANNEPVIIEDLNTDERFGKPPLLLDYGIVSGMCVIIAGPPGRPPYGVLNIHTTRKRAFTADDINFIQAMTNILAAAIERKRIETELQEALQEKEILLKEVYHRVKNNLQAVSNLVYLQSLHVKDEPVRDMFRQTQDRIKSIALIHEKLYQASDLARIDMAEYIRSLVTYLVFSYCEDVDRIKLNLLIDDLHLDGDTALTLGIILNELVSNSLKHAFPPERKPPAGQIDQITVELRAGEDNQLVLTVADNGVGLPGSLAVQDLASMGLQLVHLLAQNMQGSVEIERGSGTLFIVKFKAVR